MGLSMRRDKWAKPIRFDNLDPLRGVSGRTQCCKIATLLSPSSATGWTTGNISNLLCLPDEFAKTWRFWLISRFSAVRQVLRSDAVRATRKSGPGADELASAFQVREVIHFRPREVSNRDGFGAQRGRGNQLRVHVFVIEAGLATGNRALQRIE